MSWVREQRYLIIAVLVSILFFMCLPSKPERTGFGIDILSAVLTVSLLSKILKEKSFSIINLISQYAVIVLFSVLLYFDAVATGEYKDIIHQIGNCRGQTCVIILEQSEIPECIIPYTGRAGLDKYYEWLGRVWSVEYQKTVNIVPVFERHDFFYDLIKGIYRQFKSDGL